MTVTADESARAIRCPCNSVSDTSFPDFPHTAQFRKFGVRHLISLLLAQMKQLALLMTTLALVSVGATAEIIDYHQHLYSPEAGARSSPGPKGISARELITHLDAAGIQRAIVLSVAYSFSNPNKPGVADEYAHVMAENDWTAAQVAQYPDRLIAFCSVNPLRAYALEEIERCAKDPNLSAGLKLHFGNSDVNVDDAEHLAQVRRVFQAANRHRMAITVHMRSNIDHHRPYGAPEARIFWNNFFPKSQM